MAHNRLSRNAPCPCGSGKKYAFEKTGRIVTEDNQHLLSDADLAEWQAASEEYQTKHGRGDTQVDEENEWF